MLIDYEYYTTVYEGKIISSEDWGKWSRKASNIVRRYTLGRDLSGSEDAKNCICEIAELEYTYATDKRVTSASNDGYSESYQLATYENERREIIYDWLSETDLLFRGAS